MMRNAGFSYAAIALLWLSTQHNAGCRDLVGVPVADLSQAILRIDGAYRAIFEPSSALGCGYRRATMAMLAAGLIVLTGMVAYRHGKTDGQSERV